VLWEIDERQLLRFRCRVGHAYSSESLLADQSDAVEAALWAALRALEENIALSLKIVNRMRKRGREKTAQRFTEQAQDSEMRAEVLRRVLLDRKTADPAEPEADEAVASILEETCME
jgi:two-component system chemotaxis response regulator CheB